MQLCTILEIVLLKECIELLLCDVESPFKSNPVASAKLPVTRRRILESMAPTATHTWSFSVSTRAIENVLQDLSSQLP